MIAKGEKEKLPKKVKYDDIEWERIGDYKNYCHFNEENCITEHILDYIGIISLNDEVEIIEDKPEEIDIQSIDELPMIIHIDADGEAIGIELNNIMEKQNQILNAVKQLDNQLKEK